MQVGIAKCIIQYFVDWLSQLVICNHYWLLVIDLLMSLSVPATSLVEAVVIGIRKIFELLRLRMAWMFLYQEENIFMISEQTAHWLNKLVMILCNIF